MSPTFPTLLPAAIAAALVFSQTAQAETVLVQAGRLLDVERGELVEGQALLIEDGRIVAVGPLAAMSVPAGTPTIDLSERTVLPGLSDAHVHLHDDADEHGYRALAISLPRAAIKGVANAEKSLQAGFTTVRQVGAVGYADVALREAVEAGEVRGPRMLVAGPSVGITGGHCGDGNLLPPDYKYVGEGVADGPWAVRQKVREQIKYGVDLIKTCATGGVFSKGTQVGAPQYTLEELTAIVEEAHSHGRKVAAHAHGATGIKNAIRAGVDSIEHSSFIDAEGIRLARERGTVLVFDVYNTEYILGEGEKAGILPESLAKERSVGATQRENFTKAHQAGATLAFGTDAGVYPHGENGKQFSRMVRFGMTPIEAIRAATLTNAKLFGMENEIGQLKPGYFADLIAVDGDPLTDVSVLENVRFVMKGGEVYKEER